MDTPCFQLYNDKKLSIFLNNIKYRYTISIKHFFNGCKMDGKFMTTHLYKHPFKYILIKIYFIFSQNDYIDGSFQEQEKITFPSFTPKYKVPLKYNVKFKNFLNQC